MSDQKQKEMGNLSRASDEIKKKLELSFLPQQNPTQKDINADVNKTIHQETPISVKDDLNPAFINTEIGVEQETTLTNPLTTTTLKTGNRYKKVIPRATDTAKSKATFCLDTIATEQLNQIYIKRLSTHQKSDRSSLICEAISLLFEKEKMG